MLQGGIRSLAGPQDVVNTTAKGFEAVRSLFLPRPAGDMKMSRSASANRLAGGLPARLRRFALHLNYFDVTEFHEFNEF